MESTLFTPVAPTRPAAPYVGGKKNLARELCARIDAVPHKTYAEPFVGMGGVFLRRTRRPRAEVINDISDDVWTFYRVLQEHYAYFREELRFRLTTRAEFERLVAVDPRTLTDLQRAARFLYLQRCAWGGRVSSRHFGVDARAHSPAAFDVAKLGPILEALHERISGVIVERLPWAAFIARYDTPETLFYLDPPYWGGEEDYGPGVFERGDFDRMAEVLAGLKGRFILSLNDTPELRRIFGAFDLDGVGTHYGLGGGMKPARELIISG